MDELDDINKMVEDLMADSEIFLALEQLRSNYTTLLFVAMILRAKGLDPCAEEVERQRDLTHEMIHSLDGVKHTES